MIETVTEPQYKVTCDRCKNCVVGGEDVLNVYQQLFYVQIVNTSETTRIAPELEQPLLCPGCQESFVGWLTTGNNEGVGVLLECERKHLTLWPVNFEPYPTVCNHSIAGSQRCLSSLVPYARLLPIAEVAE